MSSKKKIFLSIQKFSDLNKIDRTFKILSDSSYVFTETIDEANHKKTAFCLSKVRFFVDMIKVEIPLSDRHRRHIC